MHAPGCECARLKRTRECHRNEGHASGYLVVSRDARAPDLHFGADAEDFLAEPEASESSPSPTPPLEGAPIAARYESESDRTARRLREGKLKEAIEAARDAQGSRVSCAACLLDGDWRNGAVVLAGTSDQVWAACATANAALQPLRNCARDADGDRAGGGAGRGDGASSTYGGVSSVPQCVPVPIRALLKAINENEAIPLPAELELPETSDAPTGEGVVDIKHHVQEALAIVPFEASETIDDDHVLVLAYVDSRSNISLDLPGGKRRLAETAWEAAVREMSDECKLDCDHGDDRFRGTLGQLHTDTVDFKANSFVDGQSVRFFVLRPPVASSESPEPPASE